METKELFKRDDVKQKFMEILGKRSTSFITSILQIVSSNDLLSKAEPMTIYQAALVAATLDLPINNNLGFAYIVPFNMKQKDGTFKTVAQFQLGYKGFIQLAQRTGLFKTISACPIYEGQLIEQNPLTGFVFDFSKKKSDAVIGYASYFSLVSGFTKTFFMSIADLQKHGTQFSQTFKKGYGLWKDNFDAMATKTVIKLLLSKYAPLSVDMQKAVIADQAIIIDNENDNVTYVDNEVVDVDKEDERIVLMIHDAKTLDDLKQIEPHLKEEHLDMFTIKMDEIKSTKK
ncbi:recombinase RecT [Patescibacteria group bacterium]|nr:recombinase RecT [Patescibacteria group bacterium]